MSWVGWATTNADPGTVVCAGDVGWLRVGWCRARRLIRVTQGDLDAGQVVNVAVGEGFRRLVRRSRTRRIR